MFIFPGVLIKWKLLGGCSLQQWSESPLKGIGHPPMKINKRFCLIRGSHHMVSTVCTLRGRNPWLGKPGGGGGKGGRCVASGGCMGPKVCVCVCVCVRSIRFTLMPTFQHAGGWSRPGGSPANEDAPRCPGPNVPAGLRLGHCHGSWRAHPKQRSPFCSFLQNQLNPSCTRDSPVVLER